jgi:hypothetical protein
MGRIGGNPNPLAQGFYTVQDAARLIESGSARRIYGWIRGFPNRATGPLIIRQYDPFDEQEEIGFLDLMELRLIETFREHDVKPRTIRHALIHARELFRNEKPFATDRIALRTDGRHIFVEEILINAAKQERDTRLWNLITKQYEHYELIERTLLEGVKFDPISHVAKTWIPRPKTFPNIIIDPRIAYGRPTTPSNIPAESIHDLWRAENKDLSAVADWFSIAVDEVEMAVNFQEGILRPREALAA